VEGESMLVSIVISAYNEEKYLPGLIEDLKNQSYPHNLIEIILINAMSTDKTKDIMENFQKNNSDFHKIKVIDNPKKVQPSGFNLGVKNSEGDVVLKIDAHSKVTSDFVEKNVNVINTGEYVCGGKRPTIVETSDNFSKTLHLVEENMFGSSIASYRKSDEDRYVDSIFHGMYRKEVFEKAGLLNEKLGDGEVVKNESAHNFKFLSVFDMKDDNNISLNIENSKEMEEVIDDLINLQGKYKVAKNVLGYYLMSDTLPDEDFIRSINPDNMKLMIIGVLSDLSLTEITKINEKGLSLLSTNTENLINYLNQYGLGMDPRVVDDIIAKKIKYKELDGRLPFYVVDHLIISQME